MLGPDEIIFSFHPHARCASRTIYSSPTSPWDLITPSSTRSGTWTKSPSCLRKAPSLLNGLKSLGPRMSDDSCSTQSARDIVIEQRASAWKYIFAILGILSFPLLAVASVYIVLTWYMLTLKTRIVHTLMPTLPEPILHLMQPPPTAPKPNQQPLLEPIHWTVVPRYLSTHICQTFPLTSLDLIILCWPHSFMLGGIMENVRDVIAPNIAKHPQPLFIFLILMYLCNLSPYH